MFDVLAYISFVLPTITRKERVIKNKERIYEQYNDNQNQFLAFVLDQYITQGVKELDLEKLPELITLKYGSTDDAVKELGNVNLIRDMFIGFQEYLYVPYPDEEPPV